MKKLIYIILLMCCCCVTTAVAADKKFTLVIDAGHGGKDPGTVGKTAKEKNIALKTALYLGKYVEANCPDVKVVYTRKKDVFVELKERAAIANRNHADLFISIHVNSVASKKPITGIEVYSQGMRRSDEKLSAAQRENSVILLEDNYKQHYAGFDPNSPESTILFDMMFDKYMENSVEISRCIANRLKAVGRPGRVKQDNFAVLRLTALPACLVELGYVTTPSEEQYMNNDANLDKMAFAIFQAFQDYRKKYTGAFILDPVLTPEPETPAVTEEPQDIPATNGQQPAANSQQPAANSQQPTANSQQPAASSQQPTANSQQPAANSQHPTANSQQPAANGQQPTANSQQPTAIFKVQLFISKQKLKAGDKLLKGVTDFDSYQEGGYWKYTTGASADYNEIARLRRQLSDKFPEAFIIAFKDGEKTDIQKAIQEFKKQRK